MAFARNSRCGIFVTVVNLCALMSGEHLFFYECWIAFFVFIAVGPVLYVAISKRDSYFLASSKFEPRVH